ncbi:MAG TPA: hypothetical protein VNQ90_14570 [Chthoniobacteraceae bacterium]|nr:hypothetical protein [Chthoniobacteraceae bacterium]
MAHDLTDFIVFSPKQVDLTQSPLRQHLEVETYVLGAFNPGFTRLPNGNLLLMVRVAEALKKPIVGNEVYSLQWCPDSGPCLNTFPLEEIDVSDPRAFRLIGYEGDVILLTSLSWLLPVELSPDGDRIVAVHYDKAITPQRSYQEYGVEDARISKIGDTWYMTTCSVSAERLCTTLYLSSDGLNYELQGIILDHHNKDMVFFEGKIHDMFYALTRPMGFQTIAYPPDSQHLPGPSIQLARSPDALHWRPFDTPLIRPQKGSLLSSKVGGGAQPILTDAGWLVLYHGVEPAKPVGHYRTFWAILDRDEPHRILRHEIGHPVLKANPRLSEPFAGEMYLSNIVFTTGIVTDGSDYLIASGENDLLCRLTRLPQSRFA